MYWEVVFVYDSKMDNWQKKPLSIVTYLLNFFTIMKAIKAIKRQNNSLSNRISADHLLRYHLNLCKKIATRISLAATIIVCA